MRMRRQWLLGFVLFHLEIIGLAITGGRKDLIEKTGHGRIWVN